MLRIHLLVRRAHWFPYPEDRAPSSGSPQVCLRRRPERALRTRVREPRGACDIAGERQRPTHFGGRECHDDVMGSKTDYLTPVACRPMIYYYRSSSIGLLHLAADWHLPIRAFVPSAGKTYCKCRLFFLGHLVGQASG